MKRIFIAIEINRSESIRMLIASFIKELAGENIKWTAPENVHITLSFLGDTSDEEIGSIDRMLETLVKKFRPFEIEIGETGLYGSSKEPRIIWAGIKNPDNLLLLNKLIVKELTALGVRQDVKTFSPHITLGRIKSIRNLQSLRTIVQNYREYDTQTIEVNEIILFESILKPSGPMYIPLRKYEF